MVEVFSEEGFEALRGAPDVERLEEQALPLEKILIAVAEAGGAR